MRYPVGSKVKPNKFYALASALHIPEDSVGIVTGHKWDSDYGLDNIVKFECIEEMPCGDRELDAVEE